MKITPFYTALKLTFRGKSVVKIITILLSAFSFTLFALASMGFTFDREDFQVRAYRNYLQAHSHLFFYNDDSDDWDLSQDDVAFIKENTSLNFLSACEGAIDVDHYVRSYFFDGEEYDRNHSPTPEYLEFIKQKNEHYVFCDTCVLIGEEPTFKKSGIELLAGKYPEAENEIAIGKEFYDLFVWGGYCDNFDHYLERERLVENGSDEEKETEYYYDAEAQPNEREEITSHSDLIGKTLSAWEYAESSGIYENRIPKQVVITGIVDTSGTGEWKYQYRSDRGFFTNVVIRSEAWRQKQITNGNIKTQAMLAPLPLTDGQIKECINVTNGMYARASSKHEGQTMDAPAIGAYGYFLLMRVNTGVDFLYVVLIICGVGIIFLIFSIVLNAYLMTAMLKTKQKRIGILRSMGATKRRVFSYFLIGTLLLSAVIFITAIAMSLILYFGWMRPLFMLEDYGVCLFVYNGWTPLILAGISFVVPVLSVLLPLKRFLRRSCVEMIKDTPKRAKGI